MASAAAVAKPLNPIKPDNAQTLLGKFAASDAKHDFATSFINIFKGRGYKDIGTSGRTPPDKYFDEWETFYNVFSDNADDRRDENYIFEGDETDPGVKFKRKVLNPGSIFTKAGLSNIHLNTDLAANHTYKLRSRLFSTGSTLNLEDSDELLQFLGGVNTDIYIQQDASFISFSDFFLSAKNPSEGEGGRKHFYYLGSREGQNDAAGKTNSDSAVVTKTIDKKVAVSIKPDESTTTIIYPKYTTDQNSDVKQNFQSIYNLSISPIQTVKGVKMVSLNFYDKETINATQKGKAENAKGNLKERLTNFFRDFSTVSQNNQSYFTALQQKRSGDWLQVLSTYDLARYNITGRRGILITHDLICAAYAIAMGVDVVITIQYGSGAAIQKWLVFFENELYLTPPTKKVLYGRYNYIKTNINAAITFIEDDIRSYEGQRTAIIPPFTTALEVPLEEFNADVATKTLQDNANGYIEKLLNAYFKYTIVLTIFPEADIFTTKLALLKINKNSLEARLNTWSTDGGPVDPLSRNLFSEYEKVISDIYNIKKSLDEFKVPEGGLSLMNLEKIQKIKFSTKSKDIQELNTFLKSFSPFSVVDPTTPDTSSTFLNRFRILKNNITNTQKKNDYGVFAMYLNKLDDTKKNEFYSKILTCKTSFIRAVDSAPAEPKRLKDKKQELAKNFELFIDEINLYFKDASAPSFEAGTTGELLSEINDIQDPVKDPEPATDAIRVEVAAMVDEGAGVETYSGVNNNKKGGRVSRKAAATRVLSGGAQDTSSIVSSTPFSIYLIWLLTKRNKYNGIIPAAAAEIAALAATIATPAITYSIGIGFFKTVIASLLTHYAPVPPDWADLAENLVFTGTGLALVIPPIVTSVRRVSEIDSYELTTDAYTTLNNDLIMNEIKLIDGILKRGMQLKALASRGLAGGGPLDSFDLPYSNWATLFYHMDTMRTQLDDINNPEHGFDYSYFARYSQFLIAMEKSIDSTIRFFTIKSPKKGGQYGTTTVVLTDEPKAKSKPTQLVLRLKGGPLDLYEVPIGYCALFTSFGDYSDLILSNLLPRVYFDSVWDELKPMLTKAFTGSEGADDAKWIGLVAETCNDNYLNTSADTNLNDVLNPKDLFLRYFLITTCYNLEQMPILDMSIAGKVSLERELNDSIKRLVAKINLVEKNIIVHMYKKKVNDDSINFESINDVGFLMEKNLLLKPSEPESKLTEGGRRKKQMKKRTYGKTKKHGRKMRLKSRRKS